MFLDGEKIGCVICLFGGCQILDMVYSVRILGITEVLFAFCRCINMCMSSIFFISFYLDFGLVLGAHGIDSLLLRCSVIC